jgi:Carboxylesterase family
MRSGIRKLHASLTEAGKVEGGLVQDVAESGLAVYKRIPFAAPPIGDLRWNAPQPSIAWSGVRERYGPFAGRLPVRGRTTSAGPFLRRAVADRDHRSARRARNWRSGRSRFERTG